jgi:opacity protein-like surface antigen
MQVLPVAKSGLLKEASMRKLWFGVSLLLLIPMAALAQGGYPKAELFGGYSYFRANPDGINLNGWNASVTANITNWFGVEGDFSGHYGSPRIYGFEVPFVDVSSHTFMAGPKLTYRANTVAPFAHLLIGAARASTGAFGYSLSDTALATVVGGGIDINVSKSLAIRAIQADYLMTRFQTGPQIAFSGFDDRQNNFRLSAGLVLKLGN